MRNLILLVFFLSGACGLIYQVIWVRMLSLIFGSTIYAVSTVLGAFMAGLALGSYLFGRLVDRKDKILTPLRLYALLELGIGAFCFFTPWLFKLIEYVYLHFTHSSLYLHTVWSSILVRFVLASLVILIPTALMGGTLPVLSKLFVQRREKLGWHIGLLYSVNTWGAVCGVFATGFILIMLMGVKGTLYAAAVINLAIGIGSYILSASQKSTCLVPSDRPQFRKKPQPKAEKVQNDVTPYPFLLLLALGLSGFTALVYEVTWTRVLTLILGTTTYAFTTMLTTFLFGLALGSIICAKLIDRKRGLWTLFALVEIIIGLSVLLLVPLFTVLPSFFWRMYQTTGPVWWKVIGSKFILSFLVMLIPTTLFGATFPLVSKLYTQTIEQVGKKIGKIYAVNTLGAIIGSWATGFALIPLWGIQKTIIACTFINLFIGGIIWWANPSLQSKIKRFYAWPLLILPILGFVLFPRWHQLSISQGVYLPLQQSFIGLEKKNIEKFQQLIYYGEGIGVTVAVIKVEDLQMFISDGRVEATNYYEDMRLQRMMGHLPVLLHQAPHRVLVIGLGIGGTLGAVAQHSLQTIECVEIEPEVINSARHFRLANHNVLSHSQVNPVRSKTPDTSASSPTRPETERVGKAGWTSNRVNIIIEDGRNFLLTTEKRYDVITADPFEPFHRGSCQLYSREYFQLCKKRLNANGIMTQYLPLYFLSPSEYKMIIKTFKSVFPQTILWFTNTDTILLGKKGKWKIDYQELQERLAQPKIKQSLKPINLDDPLAFLGCFLADNAGLTELVKDDRINTDNHPRLEFSTPKSLYSNTISPNLEALNPSRKPITAYLVNIDPEAKEKLKRYFLAQDFIIKGVIAMGKEDHQRGIEAFQEAYRINPADRNNQWLLNEALWKHQEYLKRRQ